MPTTTNFGWTTPADTDLVKDGAAAIRTLGNGIDTSLVDLKGGTTGQILSKNSNTDLDYTWVTPNVGDITEVQAGTGISVASGTGPIPVVTNTVATTFDAKGDLVVGTGADTFAKLTVGTNGYTLVADSGETTGLKWAAPASGMTLISRTSFTNVASQSFDNVFTSTYRNYVVAIEQIYAGTYSDDLQLLLRYAGPTDQTANYYGAALEVPDTGSVSITGTGNAAQLTLSPAIGQADYFTSGTLYFQGVGNTSERPRIQGQLVSPYLPQGLPAVWGYNTTQRTYTGFKLKSSSTNIYGTVAIYGLATS